MNDCRDTPGKGGIFFNHDNIISKKELLFLLDLIILQLFP